MRMFLRITESNQGLSLGLIITVLDAMQDLAKSRNVSVNLMHASFKEPSSRIFQSKFIINSLSLLKSALLYTQTNLLYVD